ncbi:MAG: type II toxin-antitoxin system prevent-host-death family antitoxin [Chloroflexi bacterium]|nr:type II toxin-antitoxin system prevent-host-death family antitoxin [Chloroflexota bacterium]MBU1660892.1 type II toxin-antitoxin system prevent-host-death family antitoxin [Chloroflexota bacterium]
MTEASVGIRELKTNLSKYLRRVKAGQIVIITERGKLIGRILPEAPTLNERMQILQARGIILQVGGKLSPREPVVINRGQKQISDLVSENRDVDYLS